MFAPTPRCRTLASATDGQSAGSSSSNRAAWSVCEPECFAVEDMNYLCAERWESEARKFFRIITFGHRQEMIDHKSQAGMSPAVQLTDPDESEQGRVSLWPDLL